MRVLLCACLFAVACKSESAKPAAAESTPTTSTVAPQSERARARPSLPGQADSPTDDGRDRPRLPEEEPRDWTDPAVREEMRQRREERRKQREAMLDTNKDGVVSPEERQQRMVPMHERLDENKDGKVTPDELASSDRRMGFDDPAAVDTDKNGEISLAELDAAVTARREQMRARWRDRALDGRRPGSGHAEKPSE